MKIVESSSTFKEALDSAKREALKGFGDETARLEALTTILSYHNPKLP